MTFLRPTDSASKPMNGAVKAIARMVALTVSETAIARGVEYALQIGKQRLRVIHVQERTHARQHAGDDGGARRGRLQRRRLNWER